VNETRRARRSSYGIVDVLLGLAVSVVASAIVASIALAATGDDELDEIPMWLYAVVQASQWIGLVGVPVLVSKVRGHGPVRDFGAWMTRRDVPFGLALGVLLQLVMVPLISWPWVLLLGKDTGELDDRAKELTDRAQGFGLFMLTLEVERDRDQRTATAFARRRRHRRIPFALSHEVASSTHPPGGSSSSGTPLHRTNAGELEGGPPRFVIHRQVIITLCDVAPPRSAATAVSAGR